MLAAMLSFFEISSYLMGNYLAQKKVFYVLSKNFGYGYFMDQYH